MKKFIIGVCCVVGALGLGAGGVAIAYKKDANFRQKVDKVIEQIKKKPGNAEGGNVEEGDPVSSNFADYNILLLYNENNMFASNKETGGIYNYDMEKTEFKKVFDTKTIFSACVITTNGNYIFLGENSNEIVVYFVDSETFKSFLYEEPVKDIVVDEDIVKVSTKEHGNHWYWADNSGSYIKLNTSTWGDNVNIIGVEKQPNGNLVVKTDNNIYDYNTSNNTSTSMMPSGIGSATNMWDFGNKVILPSTGGVGVYDKTTGESEVIVEGSFDSCSYEIMDETHILLICTENGAETYYYVTMGDIYSCVLVEFPADTIKLTPLDGQTYNVQSTTGRGEGTYNLVTKELVFASQVVAFTSFEDPKFLNSEYCYKNEDWGENITFLFSRHESLPGFAIKWADGSIVRYSTEGTGWYVTAVGSTYYFSDGVNNVEVDIETKTVIPGEFNMDFLNFSVCDKQAINEEEQTYLVISHCFGFNGFAYYDLNNATIIPFYRENGFNFEYRLVDGMPYVFEQQNWEYNGTYYTFDLENLSIVTHTDLFDIATGDFLHKASLMLCVYNVDTDELVYNVLKEEAAYDNEQKLIFVDFVHKGLWTYMYDGNGYVRLGGVEGQYNASLDITRTENGSLSATDTEGNVHTFTSRIEYLI